MSRRISIIIGSRDRRHVIANTLWSLRNQTHTLWDLVIVDDGSDQFHPDKWEKDGYLEHILKELRKNHKVEVIGSPKAGKVGANFQAGYKYAIKEWNDQVVFRCDDDVVLESDYFERLVKVFDDPKVGAASGLMLSPGNDIQEIPVGDERYQKWGKIDTLIKDPNLQWFKHESDQPFEVEFLHSIQAVRTDIMKVIGGFDDILFSNFREEDHLSWRVFVEGYKVLVVPTAVAWHLKSPTGGNRENKNSWVDDCRKFSMIKKTMAPGIHVSLTHAAGDLIMSTPMFEQLRKKYPNRNISAWHPYGKYILEGNPNIDVVCQEVFDAQRTHRIEKSIYGWMAENKWNTHISNAYCRMVGVQEVDNPIPRLYNVEPMEGESNYVIITPSSNAKVYDFSRYSRTKHWDPISNWDELIRRIKETYQCDVIHLSGKEVVDHFDNTRLINNVEYRDAFRWIKGARCVVSIDTMAPHAAAALDIPAVVMWGRSDVNIYGYEKSDIINLVGQCPKNKPCFGNVPFQQDRWVCELPNHPCMPFTIDEVMEAVGKVILR